MIEILAITLLLLFVIATIAPLLVWWAGKVMKVLGLV